MSFPLQLQLWLSPTFPVGSFAYSHGLEWAAGSGRVRDRATAEVWLGDLLQHGAVRNDAIFLAAAWRAGRDGDVLGEVNALALAMAGGRERYLETSAQGNAFMSAVCAAWGSEALDAARSALDGDIAYPVAVGAASSAAAIPLDATLLAFVASVMSNIVSALVRMSVIGQTDGQRVLAGLGATIAQCASEGARASLDDIGGAAFLSDIASLAHETQDTRMFRT